MSSEFRIEKEQEKLRKHITEKMEIQNKRYLRALKIIELLLEEKKTGVEKKTPKKRTVKLPRSENNNSDSNKLNSLLNNNEIKKLFSKYLTSLENALKFIENIKENNYKEKITSFLASEEENNQIILAKATQMIEKFINENLNTVIGIPVNDYYFELLKLYDGIVEDVLNLEPNLERITDIVSTKIPDENIFKKSDLRKLSDKIMKTKQNLNLKDIKVKEQLFEINKKKYNLLHLEEMAREINKFTLSKNPILS